MSSTTSGVAIQPRPPPVGPAGAAALPRELIRWIQTLQLSKPLKHPKRDFANGFLVAEIAARYVPAVDMNLFDNVVSSANKLANWKALQRCLAKGGVPQIPEMLVQDVMNAKDGAGDELLLMLYTQFTSRGPPGTSAQKGGAGSMAPEPQALDRVPQFIKHFGDAATSSSSSSNINNQQQTASSEATKQLAAMAAEQLRAAELELMKQRSETDLKNEVLGLREGRGDGAAGAAGGKKMVGFASDEDARAAAIAAAQQAQKARLLRQPAVPQTVAQAQIRAIDLEAEKQEKAVLFNNVSVRQLSGAALQRFGFRDRSQSPNASSRNQQQQQQQQQAQQGISPLQGGRGRGRGGIGAAIHQHLCGLFDRFVAESFASSTTWNPPADSSPLAYFIENCSNPGVITPSFKANAWAVLVADAQSTAAVLASSPIDTLYFVAHFANVSVETASTSQQIPRPGDPSFSDLSKPKFFGADAFDATYYCHVVLGALRDLKKAAAEAILRRYALPAILPVMFRRLDPTQQQQQQQQHVVSGGSSSATTQQQKHSSASLRRALFALSALSMGNCQPYGTNSLASSLKYFFLSSTPTSTSATTTTTRQRHASDDENSGENTIQLHQFIEVIYDSLLTNYEATIAYSSKVYAADAAPGTLGPESVSSTERDVEFFAVLEALCSSIRGSDSLTSTTARPGSSASSGTTTSLLSRQEIVFPESVALLVVHNIERGLAHTSSSVQEAALRALTALVQSSSSSSKRSFDHVPEIFALVEVQLRNVLLPALREPKGIHSCAVAASGSALMELLRLLCVSMRNCSSSSSSTTSLSSSESDDDRNNVFLSIAAQCVSSLHPLALRDTERLALVAALASGLSNFDTIVPQPKEVPTRITLSGTSSNGASVSLLDQTSKESASEENQLLSAREQQRQTNWQTVVNFCVDTLLALPPSALETFASTGGSIVRALPSIITGAQDRLAFSGPLEFSHWNITALGFGIASRFTNLNNINNNNNTNPNSISNDSNSDNLSSFSSSSLLKIANPTKTGSAGVLKLPSPPSQQNKPQEFTKFLLPYRMIILLFTLFLAKQNSSPGNGMEYDLSNNGSGQQRAPSLAASILRLPGKANEDNVVWWTTLSAGFGNELKKLLVYYDAARKGPAALAPRKDAEAESFHEIFVQSGRAALFIVTKLFNDISSAVPSSIVSNVPSMLSATASRVSQPASRISEDDQVIGQAGLEVAAKAIEWFMASGVASQGQNVLSSSARSEFVQH